MNKKDKELYHALKFYADTKKGEIKKLKQENPGTFRQDISKSIEIFLAAKGFIKMDSFEKYMITDKGTYELRLLQQDYFKYTTWVISIIALIISIISLINQLDRNIFKLG